MFLQEGAGCKKSSHVWKWSYRVVVVEDLGCLSYEYRFETQSLRSDTGGWAITRVMDIAVNDLVEHVLIHIRSSVGGSVVVIASYKFTSI